MDADQTNMDVPTCPGCAAAAKRIAELEARIALLEQKLEASLRSGKRQAAPFSRGLPKLDPRPPGRKAGDDYGTKAFRVVPPVIDEVYQAPLGGEPCPCGGAILLQAIVQQYQTDIPRRPITRQFDIHVGRCCRCDKRVQGRHPLQTSNAVGC